MPENGNISFRIAKVDDAPFINRMLDKIKEEFRVNNIDMWQNGYPNSDSISKDITSGDAYIASVNGVPAGYMFLFYGTEEFQSTLRGSWSDDNPSIMHRLLTSDSGRGKGLGSAMVEFWEKTAKEHGCTSLRAETDLTNIPMRNLLKKCGFEEKGLLTFDKSDKVALEKVL